MYTPLLAACASGKSEETIELLINLGADYNATTSGELSIFHLACLNGHDHILKQLLTLRVNSESLEMKVNSKGVHPIHYAAACKTGSLCLDLLVSVGVDVNMATYVEGTTAMHVAALNNRTSCALILFSNGREKVLICNRKMFFILLILKGAVINVQDSNNNTPLHSAAINGSTAMIKFLVESGANIYM